MKISLPKISIDQVLLGLIVLLALLGAAGEWWHFPLSKSLRGLSLASTNTDLLSRFPAGPFLLLLVPALVAFARGARLIGGLLMGGALAAVLVVPLYVCIVDTTLFSRYIDEAVEEQSLQFFVNRVVEVPNVTLNSSVHNADAYQYLTDRLLLVSHMLGWGWFVCVLAVVLIIGMLRKQAILPSLAPVWIALALVALAISAAGAPALFADFHYRQADQRLGLGDYDDALRSYSLAIASDPVLGMSSVLMQNATRAYFQRNGQDDPFGRMYLVIAQPNSGIEVGKAKVLDAVLGRADDSALGRALKKLAQRLQAKLWVRQGQFAYTRGDYSLAEQAFRRALQVGQWRDVRYFYACTLWRLGSYEESAQILNVLSGSIDNPAVLANIYNMLGDVHAAAGQHALSREAHTRAYQLDNKGNLWAIKGLSGT